MVQSAPFADFPLDLLIAQHPETARALLQRLYSPDYVIVAGVNRLNPQWLHWPDLAPDHILVLDAQSERLQGLQQHLPHTRAWHVRPALLGEHSGVATFHVVSYSSESSLLPSDALKHLWPNLRTVQTQEHTVCPLDHLLATDTALHAFEQARSSWMVIDCLPAAVLLKGALTHARRCALIGARVVVNDYPGLEEAHMDRVKEQLEPLGFQLAFTLEETHPSIVTAIFVRTVPQDPTNPPAPSLPAEPDPDHVAAHEALTQALNEAIAARDTALAELADFAGLQTRNQEQQQRIAALEARVAALTEELGDLTHAWEADVQAKTQAIAARDAEARATSEALKARDMALAHVKHLEQQLSALTRDKNQLEEQLAGQEQLRQQLIAEHEAAMKGRDDIIVRITNEHNQTLKQHTDQASRMQQLETENAQAHHRHQLMQDELSKAEAQIELIKDLLLREQGL